VILPYSSCVPCEGVEIVDVKLTSKGALTIDTRVNVKPTTTEKVPPYRAHNDKKQ